MRYLILALYLLTSGCASFFSDPGGDTRRSRRPTYYKDMPSAQIEREFGPSAAQKKKWDRHQNDEDSIVLVVHGDMR